MASNPTPRLAHPRAAAATVVAAGASYVGDEIAAIALAIAAHDATGSGFAVSAVVLAALLPRVIFGPALGRLIDRVETTRVLSFVSLAQAALTLALAAVPGFTARLVLLAAVSVGTAVTPNALMALVPSVAGEGRARGLLSTMSTVSRASALVGPLVGAALVGAWGPRGALLLDAASFAVFAVVFAGIGVRRHPTAAGTAGSGGAASGLALLRADQVLRTVVGVLATAIVFIGISYVATVFLAKDVLHAGDAGTGLLTAAYGGGMTLGCLCARRVPAGAVSAVATTMPLVAGIGLLVAALAGSLPIATAAYAVSGVAVGLALTGMRTLVLARVAPGALGRVFAAEGAIGATGELAALALGGLLITVFGAQVALVVAGVGAMAPSAFVLIRRASAPVRRLATA